jgi:hypothetical protein
MNSNAEEIARNEAEFFESSVVEFVFARIRQKHTLLQHITRTDLTHVSLREMALID